MAHSLFRALSAAVAACLIAGALLPSAVVAARQAEIRVTTTIDAIEDDGACSLREAVLAADGDVAVDACPAGSGRDHIVLPRGVLVLAGGTLVLATAVDISGQGARQSVIAGPGWSRVLEVTADADVLLYGLTVRDGVGDRDSNGGGISNQGTLDLREVVVRDNTALGNNEGSAGGGGGIFNTGRLSILRSTVTSNHSYWGGGLFNQNGTATVGESTFAGNETWSSGSAIYNSGRLTLDGSTIAGNAATRSPGAAVASPLGSIFVTTLTMGNTIIADNVPVDCDGPIISKGFNLVENPHPDPNFGLFPCTSEGEWSDSDQLDVDPLLGALADNGGLTPTIPLLAGSPARDAGNPMQPGSSEWACATVDQRGVRRPKEGDGFGPPRCDIGAVEMRGVK